MSKYAKLGIFLSEYGGDLLELNFKKIEGIVGFALPESARLYQAWWSNQSDERTHRHAGVWQRAGWRTRNVDVKGQRVSFERVKATGTLQSVDAPVPKFLGQTTPLPASPEDATLDYVPNPRADALYLVRFAVPEFTSLCPVTGQPDFAHLVIDYAPRDTIVESKSLKLFLGSFRNHAAFHEDCTVGIGQRLFDEMTPHWLRIGGYWYPRGGIPIDVFWQSGAPPADLWLPPQDVPGYRGRG